MNKVFVVGNRVRVAALALTVFCLNSLEVFASTAPIEQIELRPADIDTPEIKVAAIAGRYTHMTTKMHLFGLRLFAKAGPGRRVRYGKIANGSFAMGDAGAGRYWHRTIYNKNRMLEQTITPNLPTETLNWYGMSPIEACNEALKSDSDVLKYGKMTDAKVFFQLGVALKVPFSGDVSNPSRRTTLVYALPVKCLPLENEIKIQK
ncbi:MAG: hypothetical protein ABJO09_19115 [Hyphomicrobiales bacterium]